MLLTLDVDVDVSTWRVVSCYGATHALQAQLTDRIFFFFLNTCEPISSEATNVSNSIARREDERNKNQWKPC